MRRNSLPAVRVLFPSHGLPPSYPVCMRITCVRFPSSSILMIFDLSIYLIRSYDAR